MPMFDATSQDRETAKGVKMTAAQTVLNLAFLQLLADIGVGEEMAELGNWEEGEAERWMLKIVHEGRTLSYTYVSSMDKYFPCLED